MQGVGPERRTEPNLQRRPVVVGVNALIGAGPAVRPERFMGVTLLREKILSLPHPVARTAA
jgi:hypothetical protein